MGAMLDGVGILSSVRDDGHRVVDFRIDYANAAMAVIAGVAAEQQIGHTLLDLFPAHRFNGLFESYVGVVETGVPFAPSDFKYADPDAEGGPLEKILDQRVARLGDGIILSVRDVTDLERMRQERERLAEIVEESPDGMLLTDAEERIVYVNTALARDLGREPSEVVGLRALDVVDGLLEADKISAIVAVSGPESHGRARPTGVSPTGDQAVSISGSCRGSPRTAPSRANSSSPATLRNGRDADALELSELKYSTAFRTSPTLSTSIGSPTDSISTSAMDSPRRRVLREKKSWARPRPS